MLISFTPLALTAWSGVMVAVGVYASRAVFKRKG